MGIVNTEAIVNVIGLGGVGSIVARYGAVLLASQADYPDSLMLIDGDKFEPSNATRMWFGGETGNKADVVKRQIGTGIQPANLSIMAVPNYILGDNAHKIIVENTINLVCVDNFKTRKLISDHCRTLDNTVLISAGNDGVGPDATGVERSGTYGNCQWFGRMDGEDRCQPIDKYHPEIANPQDKLPTEDCTMAVMSTPQLLAANLMAASTIINSLWLTLTNKIHYTELSFDIAKGVMNTCPWPDKIDEGAKL